MIGNNKTWGLFQFANRCPNCKIFTTTTEFSENTLSLDCIDCGFHCDVAQDYEILDDQGNTKRFNYKLPMSVRDKI